jgi:hypothetical protein
MEKSFMYQVIEHQARLKHGELWRNLSDRERLREMLKIALELLEECAKKRGGRK